MTKPTTPGIAELLDALQRATAMREGVQEAKAAILGFVAGLEMKKNNLEWFQDGAMSAIDRLTAERADLEAQRDEALRDAGRYHLVRTRIGWEPKWDSPFLPCGNTKIDPEETDRQIDAAIAQRGGKVT